MTKSPCTSCVRGSYCEDKHCPKWKSWFCSEWKKFNNYYHKHKDNQDTETAETYLFLRRNDCR